MKLPVRYGNVDLKGEVKKGGATEGTISSVGWRVFDTVVVVSSKQKTRNEVRGYSRRLGGSRMGRWLGRAFWREMRAGGQVVSRGNPSLPLNSYQKRHTQFNECKATTRTSRFTSQSGIRLDISLSSSFLYSPLQSNATRMSTQGVTINTFIAFH